MARFLWIFVVLVAGCAAPLGGAIRPAPHAPPNDADAQTRAEDPVPRQMSADLRKLGGDAQEKLDPLAEGAGGTGEVGAGEGALELGSGIFGTSAPGEAEIHDTFARYCRRTGAAARVKGPHYTRVTLRGTARHSGGSCVLVADLPPRGRWRFVLQIARPTTQ